MKLFPKAVDGIMRNSLERLMASFYGKLQEITMV